MYVSLKKFESWFGFLDFFLSIFKVSFLNSNEKRCCANRIRRILVQCIVQHQFTHLEMTINSVYYQGQSFKFLKVDFLQFFLFFSDWLKKISENFQAGKLSLKNHETLKFMIGSKMFGLFSKCIDTFKIKIIEHFKMILHRIYFGFSFMLMKKNIE